MKIGRNQPCPCGSGKKYKKCHYSADQGARTAIPLIQANIAKGAALQDRLRREYGVINSYVSPVEFNGGRVWCLGSRVYLNRPVNETFHEFIVSVLRETLGEKWAQEQADLSTSEQHFIYKCSRRLQEWKRARAASGARREDGLYVASPDGWTRWFLSLAWDIAMLLHAGGLPDGLLERLRDPIAFQGARYEIAIAAIFARLDCELTWLDEDPTLKGTKHAEFVAQHRATEQKYVVEAKSRHRSGILNEGGIPDRSDPLKGDSRAVRSLFTQARKKAPRNLPFFIFVDINAPDEVDLRWKAEVQKWVDRLPVPTATEPADFNGLYVTNFSPHYDENRLSTASSVLVVLPPFVETPTQFTFFAELKVALNNYGNVPAFAPDGELLD